MEVVPVSVGVASRGWDEQHLDLEAAAAQISGADVSGFTGPVSVRAARFVVDWGEMTARVSTACESRADALRRVIVDYLATDRGAALHSLVLAAFVTEQR